MVLVASHSNTVGFRGDKARLSVEYRESVSSGEDMKTTLLHNFWLFCARCLRVRYYGELGVQCYIIHTKNDGWLSDRPAF